MVSRIRLTYLTCSSKAAGSNYNNKGRNGYLSNISKICETLV